MKLPFASSIEQVDRYNPECPEKESEGIIIIQKNSDIINLNEKPINFGESRMEFLEMENIYPNENEIEDKEKSCMIFGLSC
jgi:hypothetical protein